MEKQQLDGTSEDIVVKKEPKCLIELAKGGYSCSDINMKCEGPETLKDHTFCIKVHKVCSDSRTDFKFIGKVESATNDFYKTSVLAHFT